MVSFEEMRGNGCLIKMLENLDNENIIPPISAMNIEKDYCLIFWTQDDAGLSTISEFLTHADAFLSGMELWRYGIQLGFKEKSSFTSKIGVLLPLLAYERKTPYVLDLNDSDLQEEISSPLPKPKQYDFKRPKITITMEDLENYESENEDFDTSDTDTDIPERKQPKRSYQRNQNLSQNKSDSDSTKEETLLVEAKSTAVDREVFRKLNHIHLRLHSKR